MPLQKTENCSGCQHVNKPVHRDCTLTNLQRLLHKTICKTQLLVTEIRRQLTLFTIIFALQQTSAEILVSVVLAAENSLSRIFLCIQVDLLLTSINYHTYIYMYNYYVYILIMAILTVVIICCKCLYCLATLLNVTTGLRGNPQTVRQK